MKDKPLRRPQPAASIFASKMLFVPTPAETGISGMTSAACCCEDCDPGISAMKNGQVHAGVDRIKLFKLFSDSILKNSLLYGKVKWIIGRSRAQLILRFL